MTQRFDAFVTEYKALCEKHGLEIWHSGYGQLEVHPLDRRYSPYYGLLFDFTGGAYE